MSLQTISQILQTISTPCPTAASFNSNWAELIKEHKTTFEIDPLACSVSFYRRTGNYGLMESKDDIIEADLQLAKHIRKYYIKKYFWNTLKTDKPQSDFRTNSYRLLSIEKDWELTSRESGIFVKLPAFYVEDRVYDQFKSDFKTNRETYSGNGPRKSVIERLEYLGKTFRWQNQKRTSYWFKDCKHKLYAYTTLHNHPFSQLFEERVETPQTMEFSYGTDYIDNMYFNSIKSFSFIKE